MSKGFVKAVLLATFPRWEIGWFLGFLSKALSENRSASYYQKTIYALETIATKPRHVIANSLDVAQVCEAIDVLFFNNRLEHDGYLEQIVSKLPEIKANLPSREVDASQAPPEPPQEVSVLSSNACRDLLVMPDNLTITHRKLGRVGVRPELWREFLTRYCVFTQLSKPQRFTRERFVQRMQESFERSREVRLRCRTGKLRLVDASFAQVRCFSDPLLNFLFIVHENQIA